MNDLVFKVPSVSFLFVDLSIISFYHKLPIMFLKLNLLLDGLFFKITKITKRN